MHVCRVHVDRVRCLVTDSTIERVAHSSAEHCEAAGDLPRLQRSAGLLQPRRQTPAARLGMVRKTPFCLNFSYVCPEPVLAK